MHAEDVLWDPEILGACMRSVRDGQSSRVGGRE